MHRLVLLSVLLVGCASSPASPRHIPLDVSVGHPSAADIPVGQVRLREVRPGVWIHVSTFRLRNGSVFPMNGLVVRDGDGLLLVDTAWGEQTTAALLDAIEAQVGLPVRRAVATHFHHDRISGADALRQRGIPLHVTALTRRLASSAGEPTASDSLSGLAQPGASLRVGPVEVFYPGAGHTQDNLVVYVPEAGVLFGGCAVHEASRTTAGNVADADLDAWPTSLRRVQNRFPDVEVVVPGHGVPGGAELLSRSIEIVEAAEASTE